MANDVIEYAADSIQADKRLIKAFSLKKLVKRTRSNDLAFKTYVQILQNTVLYDDDLHMIIYMELIVTLLVQLSVGRKKSWFRARRAFVRHKLPLFFLTHRKKEGKTFHILMLRYKILALLMSIKSILEGANDLENSSIFSNLVQKVLGVILQLENLPFELEEERPKTVPNEMEGEDH